MAHVTIPADTPVISYTGDGTTVAFAFPFPFFDAGDITVYVDEVETGSGYSVAGDVYDGGFQDGTVTFVDPPGEGATVTLVRRLDIERVTDFPYPSQVLDIQAANTELDRIVAMMQGIGLDSRRALRVPAAEITVNELPGRAARANKVLGFDANGQPVMRTIATVEGGGGGGETETDLIISLVNQYLQQVFPPGIIMLWAGSVGSIPSGWALCNGSNGTPDLRNRFVVGAGQTYAVGATGGATSVTSGQGGAHNHGGGTGSHTLTSGEIPAHNHGVTDPTHGHSGGGTVLTFETIGLGKPGLPIDSSSDPNTVGYTVGSTSSVGSSGTGISTQTAGSGGGHSHTISQQGDHTHTVATVPPYYALAYIMRVGNYVTAPGGEVPEEILPDSARYRAVHFACGDESTEIEVASDLIELPILDDMTAHRVKVFLRAASSSGDVEVDVLINGTPMTATPIVIPQGQKITTATALDIENLEEDDLVTVDVIAAGTGAAGLKVALIGVAA